MAVTVPSAREPVTYPDATGKQVFSRSWFLFFQSIVERLGGSSGPGIGDIAESLDDGDTDAQLASQLYALNDETRLRGEVNDLRAELAELRKTVEGMQQGVVI